MLKLLGLFFLLPTYLFGNVNESLLVSSIFIDGKNVDFSEASLSINTSQQLVILLSDSVYPYENYYRLISHGEHADSSRSVFQKSTSPAVFFTSMRRGIYTFEVARSKEGPPVKAEYQLHVEITNSTIHKWYFYGLFFLYILVLFGGATYIIIITNNRNNEKILHLRSDWTNTLHNDIGGDLSSVGMRLDTLKRRLVKMEPSVDNNIQKINEILIEVQKKLRFVFNLVDPQRDSLEVMLSEVFEYARDNADFQNINLEISNRLSEKKGHRIDIGRINKLYLAMKEVLNNSFKYSNADNILIAVYNNRHELHIDVNDDGIGFDEEAEKEGNGLKNLRQYSRDGIIDISIDTEPGQGTKINMVMPFL